MSPAVLVGSMAIAAVVAIVLAVGASQRSQRVRALPVAAKRAGLLYSDVDRFNSTAVAFPLFRAGDGRVVENVMWRDGTGPSPTRVFDYGYYSEHRQSSGMAFDIGFSLTTGYDADSDPGAATAAPRTWHHFTSALAQHNGEWPAIRVAKEGVVDKAFQKLGLPDIDFESEEFNRTFVVQCADRRFASALIDPQMMDLLLPTRGEITFETKGRFLLLTAPRAEAAQMPALLNLAEQFLRHVPPAVRELYPTFPDGAGTDVFPLQSRGTDPSSAGGLGDMASMTSGRAIVGDEDDAWDPTPGVDHDLEGHAIAPPTEDPWHDRPLPPDHR